MPKNKMPRPEALLEISGAFDALVRSECALHDPDVAERISEILASRRDAIDRLQVLEPKLDAESEEARRVAHVLDYVDTERALYADLPLGDAIAVAVQSYQPPDATEQRRSERLAWKGLGMLEEKARSAGRRSESMRCEEKINTEFNRRVAEALANLPIWKGQKVWCDFAAVYPELWNGVKDESRQFETPLRAKDRGLTWKKERIADAKVIHAAQKASGVRGVQPSSVKCGG